MKSLTTLLEKSYNNAAQSVSNEEVTNSARLLAAKFSGGKEDKNANVMARYLNPGQLTDIFESLGAADILACYFINHPELQLEFAKAFTLAIQEAELEKMADRVSKIM